MSGAVSGGKRRLLSLPGVEFDARQTMGGATLLAAVPDRFARLVILDPQYRALLDKQKYGNEGARQIERARLPQMSDADIAYFVEEIARVLRPSGHLALWIDKFTLGEAHHHRWFRNAPDLRRVDLFHWDKTLFGMGSRWRTQSEYIVLAQKAPQRAKGAFTDRGFPDTLPEGADRSRHAHAKPHGITLRLIKALTSRGDVVLDPCAGGYGVLDACRTSGRTFLGCDLR